MDNDVMLRKRLADVLDCISNIEGYMDCRPKRFDVFCSDGMFRSAVLYNVAIIGEAVGQILKLYPEIKITAARKIVNTRNYIIHGYDSLDNEILWGIIINHLPKLKLEILEAMR